MKARTFAVVVNWNGGAQNLAAVESLLAQGLDPKQIVFVDNGSSDGMRQQLALRYPTLPQIVNHSNLGYGAGNNQGIRWALEHGAAAVLLVNNDVTLEAGCLDYLLGHLEREPSLGIVGPRVLEADRKERVWAAGGRLDWRQNLSTLRGHGALDGPQWQREEPVDYVIGCALLARCEVFEMAGELDAAYFAYHEDLEFCVRARAAGFDVRHLGQKAAYHDAHHSTGGGYNPRRKYMMGVNTIWFLRAHGHARHWLRFIAFDVLTLPPLFLLGLINGRWRGVLAKALGTWDGLRGRRVTPQRLDAGGTCLW
jgi:GT2 family glycosyltransferase